MCRALTLCMVLAAVWAATAAATLHADDAKKPPLPAAATPEQARQAIARGLDFLQKDAIKWRKERECATCHHGTLTVWALSEAKQAGYPVAAEVLADMAKWTKDRWLAHIDQSRATGGGASMMSTPVVYLALLTQAVPRQEVITAEELRRIEGHLLRHQEADGSWSWASAPAKNRPPPFFESDEVATRLVDLALAPLVPADPGEKSAAREARAKSAAWLAKTPPTDTTQAAALRLLGPVRASAKPPTLTAEIDRFLARQNKDGGWPQLPNKVSDAYATGQALYALRLAGVPRDKEAIMRGVAFLVATQKEDGSWPMTRRGHPGVTPGNYVVPIIYFGSAWGTLGLIRAVGR